MLRKTSTANGKKKQIKLGPMLGNIAFANDFINTTGTSKDYRKEFLQTKYRIGEGDEEREGGTVISENHEPVTNSDGVLSVVFSSIPYIFPSAGTVQNFILNTQKRGLESHTLMREGHQISYSFKQVGVCFFP